MKPVETQVAILAAAGDPEWGVEKIRADEAWADGVLGQGIVVANVDTGVDFTHPALVEQYRGNNGGGDVHHDYNWWDPTGICGDEPCDNVGHGTHTMGTMVGGDGPGPFTPDIGVAPGAQWIAAKGCEDFGCTETSLLSSGQFILAPTDLNGENPDPSKRPDIVNNSWGSGPGDTFYLETVQAWRAAGIIPVFSSGNPGPFCGEGGSPGDFLESFSVGATDIDDQIADFSGRGPSVFGKVNPDVVGPRRRRRLERPRWRLRGLRRHLDGRAPRRGHPRADAVRRARAARRLRRRDRRGPRDRRRPPRRQLRRRRGRRPEQRLRRRPHRRQGRRGPRGHRRHARRHRHRRRDRPTRSPAPA